MPALSLYVTADPETGEVLESETRLERVMVRENLRHNMLDAQVTEASLADPAAELPYGHWLRPLWKLAQALSAQRENVRGKPETTRASNTASTWTATPTTRTPRCGWCRASNAPLDRMVAEYMILANNLWGGLLHQHGVPGIYRSQQAGRVRMSTQALPHEAIGVPQYAWSTSPLRRYVDLVNQWQLIAAVEHGVSARLVAPSSRATPTCSPSSAPSTRNTRPGPNSRARWSATGACAGSSSTTSPAPWPMCCATIWCASATRRWSPAWEACPSWNEAPP